MEEFFKELEFAFKEVQGSSAFSLGRDCSYVVFTANGRGAGYIWFYPQSINNVVNGSVEVELVKSGLQEC